MDLMTLFKERYSTRHFADRKVAEADVAKLLEAVRIAPTAHNFQAFHVYRLKGEGVNNIIGQITPCNYHAPLNLLITVNRGESWKRQDGYDLADIDTGIVGTQIMLMAQELGLGCCWIADIKMEAAKKVLNLREDEELVTLFEIGYKAEGDKPSPWHAKRKSMEQIVSEIEC
jgi:nitroreductase